MNQTKLYKHFISSNYANIKTKSDDFRKPKKKSQDKTRGRS